MRKEDKIIIATSKKKNELEEDDYEYNEDGDLVPKKYVSLLKRNPNGANEEIQDPRQELTWKFYIQGLIQGKPNAKAAALRAGYGEKFAGNVVNTKWWKERKAKLRRKNMLTRAEYNLSKLLRMDYSKIKVLEDGSKEEVIDKDLVKVVADTSKFIAQTIGKDDGYSTKVQEDKSVSHDIKIESVSYADAIEIPTQAQEVIKEAVVEEIQNG